MNALASSQGGDPEILAPEPCAAEPGLARLFAAWFDLSATLLALATLFFPSKALTALFLYQHDVPVLAGLLAAAAAGRMAVAMSARWVGRQVGPSSYRPQTAPTQPQPAAWAIVLGLTAFVFLAALVGSQAVMESYPLSLDEFMARFGATIHAHGQAMVPVPQQWRAFVVALEPQFMLHAAANAAWTSSYFPGNAALQALAGLTGAPALASAVLAAVSIVLIYRIGRTFWPGTPWPAVTAAVLLATSSQFLLIAMTPYAMTAHLALNLAWLWLFQRGGHLDHLGAVAIGALACGLHQLAFHPLFVAPFVLQLWLGRRWRLAVFYTLAYGVICLFWTEYGHVIGAVAPQGSTAAMATGLSGPAGLLHEADGLIQEFDPASFGLMAANLVRFATWQNPLLAPLLLVGLIGALRAGGMLRSLLLGIVLTLAAMVLLVPYQGHGWGYRYVHGLLGSACLIAAQAWTPLARAVQTHDRAIARWTFGLAAAASLAVLLPIRAIQANTFLHPYVAAEAKIKSARTDLVLVDDSGAWFAQDFVRNDPYLRNRPVVLDMNAIRRDQLPGLCERYTISVFDRADSARFGVRTFRDPRSWLIAEPRLDWLRTSVCGASRTPVRDVFGQALPAPARS